MRRDFGTVRHGAAVLLSWIHCAAAWLAFVSLAEGQVRIDKVAISGDIANTSTGEVFGGLQAFERPRLNSSGMLAFAAKTRLGDGTFNHGGVWTGNGTSLTRIAFGGDVVQSSRGPLVLDRYDFSAAIINASGVVAFCSTHAIITRTAFAPIVVVRDGDAASGGGTYVVPGTPFGFTDYPRLDASGRIAARLQLNGVSSDQNLHGLIGSTTSSQVLIRKGQAVFANGPVIGSIGVMQQQDGPKLVARVGLDGAGTNSSNDAAIVVGDNSGASLVLREGEFLPDRGGRTIIQLRNQFSSNAQGRISMAGRVSNGTGDLQAILSGLPGSMGIAYMQSEQAPGFPVNTAFNSFQTPVTSSTGDLAFFANVGLQGEWGLFASKNSVLSLITKSGAVAPGTGGALFSDSLFDISAAINANGQVAFDADLSDGKRALFATDPSGTLQLVAAEGRMLQVSPGDLRRITLLRIAKETDAPGLASTVFNDQGQVAFHARFENGTEGVFLATVPSPGAALCSLVAGAFAFARRRQRS